jgi:hypothetical protein
VVLDDPLTSCTRSECPLVFPSWTITSDAHSQGLWRRYAERFPYLEHERERAGYDGTVQASELKLSVFMATLTRFVRYFGDERYAAEEQESDAEAPPAESNAKKSKRTDTLPSTLTRHVWDDVHDDATHTDFDHIFTRLLPGHKIVFGASGVKTNAWRRLRNGRLQFARYLPYDLSLRKTAFEVTNRSMHFQTRLFERLPWLQLPVPASWRCATLVSPLCWIRPH